jgi:enoyl-CoA hydratase/carnithine racemase
MSDMMLTGWIFSAQDAERARLVQFVVPPGGALAKANAKELAHRIAENKTTTNDRGDGGDCDRVTSTTVEGRAVDPAAPDVTLVLNVSFDGQ